MTKGEGTKPEILTNFEDKMSALLTKAVTFGMSGKITRREEVLSAIAEVYNLFYDVVEQASYLQETIKLMHEMEKEIQ